MRYPMVVFLIAGNRAPQPLQSLLQEAIENSSEDPRNLHNFIHTFFVHAVNHYILSQAFCTPQFSLSVGSAPVVGKPIYTLKLSYIPHSMRLSATLSHNANKEINTYGAKLKYQS